MAPNLRTLGAQAHRSIAARFSSSSPESTAAGGKVVARGRLKRTDQVARFSSSSPASYNLSDIKEEQQKRLSEAKERLQQEQQKLLELEVKTRSESV